MAQFLDSSWIWPEGPKAGIQRTTASRFMPNWDRQTEAWQSLVSLFSNKFSSASTLRGATEKPQQGSEANRVL